MQLDYRGNPISHLACLVFSDEDVPSSQVSVDKGLAAEIVHTHGHLYTELRQHSSCV